MVCRRKKVNLWHSGVRLMRHLLRWTLNGRFGAKTKKDGESCVNEKKFPLSIASAAAAAFSCKQFEQTGLLLLLLPVFVVLLLSLMFVCLPASQPASLPLRLTWSIFPHWVCRCHWPVCVCAILPIHCRAKAVASAEAATPLPRFPNALAL